MTLFLNNNNIHLLLQFLWAQASIHVAIHPLNWHYDYKYLTVTKYMKTNMYLCALKITHSAMSKLYFSLPDGYKKANIPE